MTFQCASHILFFIVDWWTGIDNIKVGLFANIHWVADISVLSIDMRWKPLDVLMVNLYEEVPRLRNPIAVMNMNYIVRDKRPKMIFLLRQMALVLPLSLG